MPLNCRVKILIDYPLGRFQAGECGDMLSNNFPQMRDYYFIKLDGEIKFETSYGDSIVGQRRFFVVTNEVEVLWGIPPSYIEDHCVKVEATSVEDYLDQHYKADRFRDRGEKYAQALINNYQEELDLNGWIHTSHYDSKCGDGIYWALGPKRG